MMRPLMQKVAGFRPVPADAADAWSRIDSFFAKHLR
jgi:carboxymethylenebutenolidase